MDAVRIMRVGVGGGGLARAAMEAVQGLVVNERTAEAFVEDEGCYLMVAAAGEEVVGCLVGYALKKPHRRERQMLLYSLDVNEAWRRKGIGTALVRAFIEEGRRAGAYGVWVLTNEANRAAVRVYERCGFVRVNRDDVMMEAGLKES